MSTSSIKTVRGKRIRVTKLGPCGTPPEYGEACAFVTSSGFVSVTMAPQNETGTELTQLNADGALCVNEMSNHNFKRWNLSIQLCDVDPDLVSMLTNVTLETDAGGDTVGFRSVQGQITQEFALEVWAGVGGGDCADGVEYGYLLFPWVHGGVFNDLTIENGVANLTIADAFTKAGGAWGVGPYNVVPDAQGDPAPLGVAIQDDEHHVHRLTTIAPPAAVTGCQPAAQ